MLRLEDVSLSRGARDLLEGADLHVRPGEKVALVGRNGAGKTSLLRLLVGELEPAAGRIHRRSGATLGYLPQQAVSGSTRSVWEEARSGMTRILALQAELERAEDAVVRHEEGAAERLGDATEAFRLAGGFAQDERVGEVLHGLGFTPEAWERPCDTFSGGWQMRIALARLLLSDPDVLLLDEPTNHLDLTSRSWLAKHLAGQDRTMVIVSHDRHLLDRVATHTVEIRHRALEGFHGNLSAWIRERALRDAQQEAAAEKQQAEVAKLERFVERFGAKATKAAQANSRKKALERMDRIEVRQAEGRPRLVLPEAPGSANELLQLEGASLGWGEIPVLEGVDLTIRRGERWAVLGPNGVGKSTLLHGLSGRLAPLAGRRRAAKDVRLGIYGQDLAQELPADRTALEHVLLTSPSATEGRARSALGALGLSGDAALRPIGKLSGGEKARVVLAAFALKPANLLLLDEPTNHLDAVTVEVLADALDTFEGGVLVVTHDRWLVERLATHVAIVADGGVRAHPGVLPEDLEPVRVGETSSSSSVADEPAKGKLHHEARKELRRQRKRLASLEQELERVAADVERIDAALIAEASDFEAATRLGAERDAAEAKLEALMEEMAELEEALEGAE